MPKIQFLKFMTTIKSKPSAIDISFYNPQVFKP